MDNTGSERVWHVLLAEDTPMNQRVEKAMLEYCGCRVVIAENGREAVDAFSREPYDIIFMDCQMPVMDGYETTGVIRGMEAKGRDAGTMSRTPIVALTAYAMEGDRERCLQAGMDDYLSKPFSIEGLRIIIDRWLVKRRSSGEARPEGGDAPVAVARKERGEAEGPELRELPPPVERTALDMIATFQQPGADDVLKRIVSIYLDSSLELMKTICGAARGDDADALHRAAHTLKSSSASVGAAALSGMCKELEVMGRTGATSGAKDRLAVLEREYARVREYLEKFAAARG